MSAADDLGARVVPFSDVLVYQDKIARLWKRVEAAEEQLALCAAETTAADLRQTIAHIEAVLDRFTVTNLARENPSQMVTDLIAETRYQIASQPTDQPAS